MNVHIRPSYTKSLHLHVAIVVLEGPDEAAGGLEGLRHHVIDQSARTTMWQLQTRQLHNVSIETDACAHR